MKDPQPALNPNEGPVRIYQISSRNPDKGMPRIWTDGKPDLGRRLPGIWTGVWPDSWQTSARDLDRWLARFLACLCRESGQMAGRIVIFFSCQIGKGRAHVLGFSSAQITARRRSVSWIFFWPHWERLCPETWTLAARIRCARCLGPSLVAEATGMHRIFSQFRGKNKYRYVTRQYRDKMRVFP